MRAGGETWIAGSYDPDLDLTYWGIAQAKPWMPASRGTASATPRSTPRRPSRCSADDGTLAWHFQHMPGESLDLDEVFERVLVDIGTEKALFTIGKAGILWKLDRRTGKFLGHKETVFQNVFDTHRSRRPACRPTAPTSSSRRSTSGLPACPSTEGGHNWQAMSYHPGDAAAGHSAEPVVHGDRGAQGRVQARARAAPPPAGASSRCRAATATSASSPPTTSTTMKEVWSREQRAAFLTAALTTGGGVVFIGDLDRYFRAFDVKTGEMLWETRLGTSVQGFPVSFTAERQAVHRGDDRPRRRQPARGAAHDLAGDQASEQRPRALRVANKAKTGRKN